MWWSACARKPAYTSAIAAKSLFSSSFSESHGRAVSSSGNGCPFGPVRVSGVPIGFSGGQLGVGRHDAELLLARQCLLAHRLVPHVEASLELVDPFLRRVMGSVAGARRVIEEERLLRRDRLGIADELERLVGDVVGEVIALFGRAWLVDRVVVVDEVGIPLVRLGAEEPVPTLEATSRRPIAPGAARFISSVGQRCHLPTM